MPARSWAQVGPGGPRLDLALDMVDGGGVLELTLEYNADLFSERSMRQMAGHYLARHPAIPRLHACRSRLIDEHGDARMLFLGCIHGIAIQGMGVSGGSEWLLTWNFLSV